MDTENLHVHKFRETVVPPTCKENGYTLYICDCGYEHKANFKPIVGHSYRTTETVPATCTEPGQVTGACTVCGESVVQSTPALGHSYGYWIVKDYPSCQTPGKQIRKCSRCPATEESTIRPTGHKPVPDTARYANGKMVEFFCENCGQTVKDYPKPKTPGYWPTKIAIILTILVAFVDFILNGVCVAQNVVFYAPWVTFGRMPLWVVTNLFVLLKLKKIKAMDRYSRWLGIATLVHAAFYVSGLVASYMVIDRALFAASCLSYGIQILPLFLLTVILFTGMKKNYWVYLLMLGYTLVRLLLLTLSVMGIIIQFVERGSGFELLFYLFTFTSTLLEVFIALELTMLVFPNKKPAAVKPKTDPYVI